ncbi:hypothetical protein ACEQ8H_008558 [Pleosporales sp. CAS-2024a]
MGVAISATNQRRFSNTNYDYKTPPLPAMIPAGDRSPETASAVQPSSQSCTLLSLPREIRDLIYGSYVRTAGGYVYRFHSNKLVQANGSLIDLSLIYTCHQVAREMRAIPWLNNSVTFSTFFSESTREATGQFHAAIDQQRTIQTNIVDEVGTILFDQSMAEIAEERYPMFDEYIKVLERSKRFVRQSGEPWGQPMSLWKDFEYFVLCQMSKHPDFVEKDLRDDKVAARKITEAVGSWIAEAVLLPSLGMPDGSFTLIFDGDPTPSNSTAVFNIIQRDAAWQEALTMSYDRHSIFSSWLGGKEQQGYIYEGLPSAIQNISTTSPLVRCNFDPGTVQDAAALAAERQDWTLQQWTDGWDSHEPREFETEEPLPPWPVLRWQRVMPDFKPHD